MASRQSLACTSGKTQEPKHLLLSVRCRQHNTCKLRFRGGLWLRKCLLCRRLIHRHGFRFFTSWHLYLDCRLCLGCRLRSSRWLGCCRRLLRLRLRLLLRLLLLLLRHECGGSGCRLLLHQPLPQRLHINAQRLVLRLQRLKQATVMLEALSCFVAYLLYASACVHMQRACSPPP